eukprot:TRINITY_DN17411_c0_g1_i1.p1 TRINITY_DN17411_c0_g1~~TRINITY_DN17411_c0_g1_i1.p1  ORF type:complete len:152 (-),score=38.25 TRINITY_DN17411_c0_g1_i1:69-485(-)
MAAIAAVPWVTFVAAVNGYLWGLTYADGSQRFAAGSVLAWTAAHYFAAVRLAYPLLIVMDTVFHCVCAWFLCWELLYLVVLRRNRWWANKSPSSMSSDCTRDDFKEARCESNLHVASFYSGVLGALLVGFFAWVTGCV